MSIKEILDELPKLSREERQQLRTWLASPRKVQRDHQQRRRHPLGPTTYLGVASLFWFLSEYKKAVDNIYRLFFGKHCEVFAGVTTHDICRFDKLFFWRHNETFRLFRFTNINGALRRKTWESPPY